MESSGTKSISVAVHYSIHHPTSISHVILAVDQPLDYKYVHHCIKLEKDVLLCLLI